ncbi:MAG TPA: serine hydrolase domain-containing protein [Sphingobacterium sp.]|nr:serine hydrolase domain-containing protein [Sphingobacterium sp.]
MNKTLFCFMFLFGYFLMSGHGQEYAVLTDSLKKMLSVGNHPGVAAMVAKDGEVLYAFYDGQALLRPKTDIDGNTRFRMASVSKQVTARAVYALIEAGHIRFDTRIGDYFDGLPARLAAIQVGHLLQHTSGISDYENLIPPDQTEQILDADVLDLIRRAGDLYFEPGSRFRYSNTGYCLLALLVEKVGGKRFDSFVKEHLFLPRGINGAVVATPSSNIVDRAFGYHPGASSSAFADQSVTSATQGDGGVYFSSLDFLTWSSSMLAHELQTPAFRELFVNPDLLVKDVAHYHLGLFSLVDQQGGLHLFHSGESTGFRNVVYYDVENRTTVSVFSNRDDDLAATVFDCVMTAFGKKKLFDDRLKQSVVLWLSKVYQGE